MYEHTKVQYSISDALKNLGIGRTRLYEDINSGLLKSYTIGKRRFISPSAIDEYIEYFKKEAN